MTPALPVRLDRQIEGRLPAGYGTGHEQASLPESVRWTWGPFADGGRLPSSPAGPMCSAIEAISCALRKNSVKTALNSGRCNCVEPPTPRGQ